MRKYYIILVTFIFFMSIAYFGNSFGRVEAQENIYVVKAGDTLFAISRQHGVSVDDLSKANNLSDHLIAIGQEIIIPPSDGRKYYSVQHGDTLYSIAAQKGISVERLKQLNNLADNLIIANQKLYLGEATFMVLSNSTVQEINENQSFSKEDIMLLARMIHAEARGESYQGKVAVGAVIINRINSPEFPSTMRGVIYQPTRNGYQFTPVQDGSINLEPDEVSIKAAYDAINGVDPTGGSLYFYNPDIATDEWITTLPVTTKIGNHLFAR